MESKVVYKSFAITLSNELLSEDIDLNVVKLYTFLVGKETDSESYIVIDDSACSWIEDFCSIIRKDGTRTIVDRYV